MSRNGLLLAASFLLLISPSISAAQIINGDFEAGGTGWTPIQPPNWTVSFPPAGGNPNGYARIQSPFGNSQGLGCVTQAFECGKDPAASCVITIDYQHASIDAGPLTGRVKIFIDQVLVHTSPPSNNQPWTTVTVTAHCGRHELALCLEVDAGNNGWFACFDNVRASCEAPTPIEEGTWGAIKSIYY